MKEVVQFSITLKTLGDSEASDYMIDEGLLGFFVMIMDNG